MSQATSELQPLPPSRQAVHTRTLATGCQTVAWDVLVSEAVATERIRTQEMQSKLDALRAQLQEHEKAGAAAKAAATSRADGYEALMAELLATRQSLEEEQAAHRKEQEAWEEERQGWMEEKVRWQREVAAAGDAQRRHADDLQHLRSELKCSKEDTAVLRKKCCSLQKELELLGQEKDSLSREKDTLLERLEVEQAEMIARVDALQRQMLERPCKVR
jgi:chromosome segregation ATPase